MNLPAVCRCCSCAPLGQMLRCHNPNQSNPLPCERQSLPRWAATDPMVNTKACAGPDCQQHELAKACAGLDCFLPRSQPHLPCRAETGGDASRAVTAYLKGEMERAGVTQEPVGGFTREVRCRAARLPAHGALHGLCCILPSV